MSTETDLVENLRILDHTAQTLNRAVDMRGVLSDTLAQLVRLMGLETGWIVLRDPTEPGGGQDGSYKLAAYHNLPPAMEPQLTEAWAGSCECQRAANSGRLGEAYNMVMCSRLANVRGERRGLAVHASTPLRSGDSILGILNVAAPDWSSFRPAALTLLSSVGRQMGEALERTRFFDQLQEQHHAAMVVEKERLQHEAAIRQQLEEDLARGQQIQLGLLPSARPEVPGWECACYYQAARQVGGDFYDFIEFPGEPGKLGMVIADAVDKGVSAALLMALGRSTIRASALSNHGPASALLQANESLVQDSRSSFFLSAIYGVLDIHTGRLVYANAGHNRPLWQNGVPGGFNELEARGMVLGVLKDIELEEREIDVGPGDLLIFYTDGVTEAMNAHREQFGRRRLRKAAAANPDASAEEVLEAVVDAVQAFTGDRAQSDDLTLIVIKRRGTTT